MNSSKSIAWLLAFAALCSSPILSLGEVNKAEQVAPDVYFHEGDLKGSGHCNNGWIVFEDYVLVVDGNFPSGAHELIPKIKAVTDKPIRFAFDTHHHGDHAYGNQVWVDNGAVPVAHAGVIDELKKYETGFYGGQPGRWEDAAKSRKDVAASKLKPPTLLYNKDLIFDDGRHRVELLYFGVAHTHGDGFAWLPKEKILFTGDACVNGPYNYMGDGDSEQWVKTLAAAKKLGAKTICPGHGPMGTAQVLEDQQRFLVELRKQVKKYAGRKPEEAKTAVADIKAALLKQKPIARYVGDFLPAQVEKVYVEMGGTPFQPKTAAVDDHKQHAHEHCDDGWWRLGNAAEMPASIFIQSHSLLQSHPFPQAAANAPPEQNYASSGVLVLAARAPSALLVRGFVRADETTAGKRTHRSRNQLMTSRP